MLVVKMCVLGEGGVWKGGVGALKKRDSLLLILTLSMNIVCLTQLGRKVDLVSFWEENTLQFVAK